MLKLVDIYNTSLFFARLSWALSVQLATLKLAKKLDHFFNKLRYKILPNLWLKNNSHIGMFRQFLAPWQIQDTSIPSTNTNLVAQGLRRNFF